MRLHCGGAAAVSCHGCGCGFGDGPVDGIAQAQNTYSERDVSPWQAACRNPSAKLVVIRASSPLRWLVSAAVQHWPLVLIGTVYTGLLVGYRHYTVFYDGGIYYSNITRLLFEPFRWDLLHMEQHPSVPYTLLIAAGQWLDHGNMVLLVATNLALAAWAAAAFHSLLRRLFGTLATSAELGLCTLLLAFTPVLVVHAFHLNLDYPLMVFFVLFLKTLHRGSRWLTVAAGLLLLLTKETSALYYAATVSLYLLCYVLRPSRSIRTGLTGVCRQWHLFLPGAIYVLYQRVFWHFVPNALYWGNAHGIHPEHRLWEVFADTNLSDPGIQSYLVNIFVLNFHWLLLLFILAWAARELGCWLVGQKLAWPSALKHHDVLFHALLLLALAYGITRVRPWNNPRYALVAYPVLVIVAEYALIILIRRPIVRIGALAVTLSVVILSNVRTFDPVSQAFYGTIHYGSHAWLNMTSRLGPEEVHRDMQAYNLELLELDFMMDEALRDLRPRPGEILLASPWANFFLPDRIDPESGRNSWRIDGTYAIRWNDNLRDFVPQVLPLVLGTQRVFHFFAFPNLNNDESLALLLADNHLLRAREYGRQGYTMKVYSFVLIDR